MHGYPLATGVWYIWLVRPMDRLWHGYGGILDSNYISRNLAMQDLMLFTAYVSAARPRIIRMHVQYSTELEVGGAE